MTYKVGDLVYYQGYIAEVLAVSGKTMFKKTQRYLIEPYPEQMFRTIAKETELLPYRGN